MYEDLYDYMKLRKAMAMHSNGDFLGFNLKAKTFSTFLKKAPLRKNSFFESSGTFVTAIGIKGCGFRTRMTMHGLRATTVTLLLQAVDADSSVAMRTGHREFRTRKSYHNLIAGLGMRQQESLCGACSCENVTKKVSSNRASTVIEGEAKLPEPVKWKENDAEIDGEEALGLDRRAKGGERTVENRQEEVHRGSGDFLIVLSNLAAVSGGPGNVTLDIHFNS